MQLPSVAAVIHSLFSMQVNINYIFKNKDLLQEALTHPSLSALGKPSYERLEFFGDNVLNLIIAEILYRRFPHMPEGKLSLMHSNLVRTQTLAQIARNIEINNAIQMAKSEEQAGGRNNENNLENAFEALVGAVFLDSDYETTKAVFASLWENFLNDETLILNKNPKSQLQEWSQKEHKVIPEYRVIQEEGNAHDKTFTVKLTIGTFPTELGLGKSIKQAQIDAAIKFISKHNIKDEQA